MTASVREQLDQLLSYAKGVVTSYRSHADQPDIVVGGRGYLGGALTTMLHLGLLTFAEYEEWWGRLMDELPPTDWVAVSVD